MVTAWDKSHGILLQVYGISVKTLGGFQWGAWELNHDLGFYYVGQGF